jgi:hypothetical protein
MDLGPNPLTPGFNLIGVFMILEAGQILPLCKVAGFLQGMEFFRRSRINALAGIVGVNVDNVAVGGVASRLHVSDMVATTLGRDDPIAAGCFGSDDFLQRFTPHGLTFPVIAAPAPHPQSPGGNSWRR